MPDIGSRREAAPRRSSRRPGRKGWFLASAVVLASATIGGAASVGDSPIAAARVLPVQGAHTGDAASSATLPANDFARAAAPATPQTGTAGTVPATPRVVVHTMSMDAPIQGGLTAHQEQALSARLRSGHRDAATAPKAEYWTPDMGRTAVARAESWLGMPYSWAGGDAAGPTTGQCSPGTGGDLDCHVVGFDCSGLTMYAWGSYLSMPHLADTQRAAGAFHPTVKQLLPGDLVFFSGYLPGGVGHVAIYTGDGMVIEAPQSGSVVRRTALRDLMAEDGTYRGAVRPLTGVTPTLATARVAVSTAGGTVTLRGAHLAGVDAVHLGGVVVQRFAQHTDSVIVFRAPAHAAGTVALDVSTTWQARSGAVGLTYAKPKPAAPVTSPTTPVTSPTAPVSSPTAPVTPPKQPVSTPPATTSSSSTSGSHSPSTTPTTPSAPSSSPSSTGSTSASTSGSSSDKGHGKAAPQAAASSSAPVG